MGEDLLYWHIAFKAYPNLDLDRLHLYFRPRMDYYWYIGAVAAQSLLACLDSSKMSTRPCERWIIFHPITSCSKTKHRKYFAAPPLFTWHVFRRSRFLRSTTPEPYEWDPPYHVNNMWIIAIPFVLHYKQVSSTRTDFSQELLFCATDYQQDVVFRHYNFNSFNSRASHYLSSITQWTSFIDMNYF